MNISQLMITNASNKGHLSKFKKSLMLTRNQIKTLFLSLRSHKLNM